MGLKLNTTVPESLFSLRLSLMSRWPPGAPGMTHGSCASDTVSINVATAGDVAATASGTVENFMLVDQTLEAHELYRLADARAIVLVTQANGDAEVRRLNTEAVMRWLGGVMTEEKLAAVIRDRLMRWQDERGFTFWHPSYRT